MAGAAGGADNAIDGWREPKRSAGCLQRGKLRRSNIYEEDLGTAAVRIQAMKMPVGCAAVIGAKW